MSYHPSLNIGIEEEYQIVDPESGELVAFVSQTMSDQMLSVEEREPKYELAQQVSETLLKAGMPVCDDIQHASIELVRMRTKVLEVANAKGLRVIAAGTHPFSSWSRASFAGPRYVDLQEDAQMIARRMLAFGLHIHIGIESRELEVDVMNAMRYLLPHVLSLSTSSPFWAGRNTGLKSYRKVLVDALPRSGIPGYFNSYQEYRNFVQTLVNTHSMNHHSKMYYDILPHHSHPTLVIRICDMLPSIQDTLALVALIQAIVAWMVDLRERNMTFRIYDRTFINENRWRAVRYGLDGDMIDFGVEEEKPARVLIQELLERVEPLAVKLNSVDHLNHIYTILERGTSSDAQVAHWREKGEDVRAVVDYLIQETEKLS
jgi:carboxylate-amine ligase